MKEIGLLISRLGDAHIRQEFDCGISELSDYLKKQSTQDSKRKVAVTYVLTEDDLEKVVGYYTLSSSTIELTKLPIEVSKKLPRYPLVPATLIGRLAVDKTRHGHRYGELLLVDALRRAFSISQEVASFAVIVEAVNDLAVGFYQKYGFRLISEFRNKLYLPMNTIARLF